MDQENLEYAGQGFSPEVQDFLEDIAAVDGIKVRDACLRLIAENRQWITDLPALRFEVYGRCCGEEPDAGPPRPVSGRGTRELLLSIDD